MTQLGDTYTSTSWCGHLGCSGLPTLAPQLGATKVVTIRFECVGPGNIEILGAGMHRLVWTNKCQAGAVISASFPRTAKHDPSRLYIQAAPGVAWAVSVWAGADTSTPSSSRASA